MVTPLSPLTWDGVGLETLPGGWDNLQVRTREGLGGKSMCGGAES